jgi:hypothetical protein
MAEDKKLRFKRLAEARTEKALNMIDLIGNLSNKSFYSYTDEEVDAIFNEIERVAEENRQRFKKSSSKKGRKFVL